MIYKASLDKLAKFITIGVFVLFIYLGQRNVKAILNSNEDNSLVVNFLIIAFFTLILVGTWWFAPQSYLLEGSELTVKRLIGKVKFKVSDFVSVRILSNEETKGIIRTFGVGGLFGYYGKFYIPKIGKSVFYATQRKNKVLIELKDEKKIIITPDDLSLVEKIKHQMDK